LSENSPFDDSKIENDDENGTNLALSKTYFDFEGIGPIESDVEPVDELKEFCNLVIESINTRKKSIQNDLFGQILTFYAVLSYEANSENEELKAKDQYLTMVSVYQDLVNNLHKKENYRAIFYTHWPGGQLPDEYKAWVQLKFNNCKNGNDDSLNAWIAKEAGKFTSATKEVYLLKSLLKKRNPFG
jgi:hypothetical protein